MQVPKNLIDDLGKAEGDLKASQDKSAKNKKYACLLRLLAVITRAVLSLGRAAGMTLQRLRRCSVPSFRIHTCCWQHLVHPARCSIRAS